MERICAFVRAILEVRARSLAPLVKARGFGMTSGDTLKLSHCREPGMVNQACFTPLRLGQYTNCSLLSFTKFFREVDLWLAKRKKSALRK